MSRRCTPELQEALRLGYFIQHVHKVWYVCIPPTSTRSRKLNKKPAVARLSPIRHRRLRTGRRDKLDADKIQKSPGRRYQS